MNKIIRRELAQLKEKIRRRIKKYNLKVSGGWEKLELQDMRLFCMDCLLDGAKKKLDEIESGLRKSKKVKVGGGAK